MNWLRRLAPLIRLSLADLGTVSLGAAAILLTRALPSASLDDLNAGALAISAAFVFLGIVLRVVAKA